MEVVAIERVDLSGRMNLEETAPLAGASGEWKFRRFASGEVEELVRGNVPKENDDDGNGDHNDNNSENEDDENRPPHRVDRLT